MAPPDTKVVREMLKDIEVFGFEITGRRSTGSGHTKLTLRKRVDSGYVSGIVVLPSSPSDWRTHQNLRRDLRKIERSGRIDTDEK